MLRKAVGKGAYEMAYSQQENALWVATSQSRSLDKGGMFTASIRRRWK
ncbi:putative receptor [Klebsiella grimontii]|uniref:Putative receptor n=1 Tax=Klebsiella grimontii TaxID=2058152 RepID=A0A7H4P4A3_9ENTR|nr:putative receptor [Klebsiella grimontii]